MKHPDHITTDYAPVSKDEIRPVVDKILSRLKSLGFHGKVTERASDINRFWSISFLKPVTGRDWKGSRVRCTGITISFYNGIGRDECKDANGRFIIEGGSIKMTGDPYVQHTASFRFQGTEIRYRRRSVETIQDETMSVFQYDDDWNAIDFQKNVDYLVGIH